MITTQHLSWREYLIEFMTAFSMSLVYGLALFRAPSSLVHIIVALAFGILFLVMRKRMIAFGNPIITVSMFALRKISIKTVLALTSFQLAAGSIAGLVLYGIVDKMPERLAGMASFAKPTFAAGSAEFIGAFLLVAGILSLISMHRGKEDSEGSLWNMILVVYSSLLISAVIGSIGMINPAVAFAMGLHFNIVYTIVPLIAGVLGAAFFMYVIEGASLSKLYKKKLHSDITE
jgi:glycerol uptake facilitator-like aquaporin